jgi:ABC-type dipeptide/oligopeptide/nickel transport system permease component
MAAAVTRRGLLGAAVVLLVSYASFVFFTTKFGPPGPAAFVSGPWQATTEWWHWLGQLVHGNLTSLGSDGPLTWKAFRHTGALLALTAVLVVVFSLALGVLAATRAGSALDLLLRTLSYVAWGIPAFVLALVLWSATRIQGWPGACAPIGGFCQPGQTPHTAAAGAVLKHLALPSAALAVSFIGLHARYLRSSLLVSLHAPYTTTARAKGLPERSVIFRHALRNSLATFVSALLLDFGAIFGAALAVDYVFRLDGVGSLFLYEISAFSEFGAIRFYSVSFLLALTAALVLLASFAAEGAVAWLDPRARRR